MKKIVAKLQRDLADPARLERLRARLSAQAYPPAPRARQARPLELVRQERIPADAPDWYFEQELRRSGLWTMMEGCYPTRRAQCQ
jgi:hypothetical protein